MISGGSWRSQSMTTMRSPAAVVSPAVIAACWPKLRLRRIARTRGSVPASPCRTSHAPSGLRSSTKTISKLGVIGVTAATIRATSVVRHSAQPNTGMTTLISGTAAWRLPGALYASLRTLSHRTGPVSSLVYRSPWIYEAVMRLLYGRHFHARYAVLAGLVLDGASVVELCCGPGLLYLDHLRARGIDYLGLDVNPRFVAALRAAGARAECRDVADGRPLPEGDILIMQASLYQFLPDPNPVVEAMLDAA